MQFSFSVRVGRVGRFTLKEKCSFLDLVLMILVFVVLANSVINDVDVQCLNMQNTLYFSLHGVTEVPRKREVYVHMFLHCLCMCNQTVMITIIM